MHPILDALDGTPHEWIKKLLFTFNEGNIGKFEALTPLFPQEVKSLPYNINLKGTSDMTLIHTLHIIAYPTRKLCVSSTEDLSDGSHRISVQKER